MITALNRKRRKENPSPLLGPSMFNMYVVIIAIIAYCFRVILWTKHKRLASDSGQNVNVSNHDNDKGKVSLQKEVDLGRKCERKSRAVMILML